VYRYQRIAHRAGDLHRIRRIRMDADGIGAHDDVLAIDAFSVAFRDQGMAARAMEDIGRIAM